MDWQCKEQSCNFSADEKVETQSCVTSDEAHEVMKRQQFIDNAFGCNSQPQLERVEFKVWMFDYNLLFNSYCV